METTACSSELFVVVGLPGSGKTTYIDRLIAEGELDGYCDDYQYSPDRRHSSSVSEQDARYFEKQDNQLFEAIAQGRRWAVADTRYCDPANRSRLEDIVCSRFADLVLKYVYFENKPGKASHNAIIRGKGIAFHQLNLIRYYTELYEIPPDAPVLKIYKV